jgi:hypothetical protein
MDPERLALSNNRGHNDDYYHDNSPSSFKKKMKELWNKKSFRYTFYTLSVIGLLLFVILMPLSFRGVEYNEYAFKRYIPSQTIYWDNVFEYGKWFWGAGYTSFTFPRTLIEVRLINLSIIPSSGLEFFLNATFYYRLNGTADSLHAVFKSFGTTGYNDQVTKLVIGDIKNNAPMFTVDEYLNNRFYVQDQLEDIIRVTLAENNIILDEGMFLMLSMQFPDRVLSKYLQTAVQAQQSITAQYEQEQTIIQQETNYMINLYLNNATYIQQTTAAQVQNVLVTANATGYNLIQEAEGAGLQYFLTQIPVTDSNDIKLIVETMAYLRNKPQFVVGDFSFFISSNQNNPK